MPQSARRKAQGATGFKMIEGSNPGRRLVARRKAQGARHKVALRKGK